MRCCVAAAVFYAVGVVAQKPVLARVSALQITWLACVSGARVSPVRRNAGARPSAHERVGDRWMVYLAIVPKAIGFLTWVYALTRTTAGQLGATMYLVTPTAVLLGWLLLDEVPPGLALVGGLLSLAGVYVARRAGSSARKSSIVSAPPGSLSDR